MGSSLTMAAAAMVCMSMLSTAAAKLSLEEAFVKDLLPPPSGKCNGTGDGRFTSTFDFTASPEGHWHAMNADYEEDAFLAQLTHNDTENSNKSWSIRVGHGGNIYSFIGAYGEVIPPQFHTDAPFVDEVWQMVAVDGSYMPGGGSADVPKWFIHQAGTYTRHPELRDEPFYSPNTARYCNEEERECGFVSWGQHAHVPTTFTSHIMYYTRFKDCGDGTIETVWGFHNAADDVAHEPDYLNVPWGGVRGSIMDDVAFSSNDGTHEFDVVHGWGSAQEVAAITDLSKTGGYTMVAENIYNPGDDDPTAPIVPCGDGSGASITCPSSGYESLQPKFIVSSTAKYDSRRSAQFSAYMIIVRFQTTIIIKAGSTMSGLQFYNTRTKQSMRLKSVHHWSWNGNMMFVFLHDGDTATKFNGIFKTNDEILIQKVPDWDHPEDNLALSFVYGRDPKCANKNSAARKGARKWCRREGRVRFGSAGNPTRDYEVFTVNAFPMLKPSLTYIAQQYVITGQYVGMDAKSKEWSDETEQIGSFPGDQKKRTVTVVGYDDGKFGAVLPDDLAPGCGEVLCTGHTTPQLQGGVASRPFFAIECGSSNYFGSNMYHFTPAWDANNGGANKPFICNGMAVNVRPTWKLVGYFAAGACADVDDRQYQSAFVCTTTQTTTTGTSTTTSTLSTTTTTTGTSTSTTTISNTTTTTMTTTSTTTSTATTTSTTYTGTTKTTTTTTTASTTTTTTTSISHTTTSVTSSTTTDIIEVVVGVTREGLKASAAAAVSAAAIMLEAAEETRDAAKLAYTEAQLVLVALSADDSATAAQLQAAQAAVEKTNSSLAQAEAGLTTANAAVIAAAAASAAANAGPTNLAESKSDGSTGTVVGVIVAVALLVAIVAAVFIKNKRSLPSPKYEAKASLVESEGGLDTAFAAAPFGGQLVEAGEVNPMYEESPELPGRAPTPTNERRRSSAGSVHMDTDGNFGFSPATERAIGSDALPSHDGAATGFENPVYDGGAGVDIHSVEGAAWKDNLQGVEFVSI